MPIIHHVGLTDTLYTGQPLIQSSTEAFLPGDTTIDADSFLRIWGEPKKGQYFTIGIRLQNYSDGAITDLIVIAAPVDP
jgi:hypothetical protein